jgi:predicted amidohydrolase
LDKNSDGIRRSRILVFPEYFLSGPLTLSLLDEYSTQFEELNIVGEFENISNSFPEQVIVFGSIIHKVDDIYKNSTLIYKEGVLLATYSKKALIYNENYICKSDDNYPIIEVDGRRISVAICWDLILPEVFRKYVSKVDLVIIPSFWGIGGNALQANYTFSLEKKYYKDLCVARAYENAYATLFVNSVGAYSSPFYSDRMMGGSLLVVPPLGVVNCIRSKTPDELHHVDVDFKKIDEYREFYATDTDFEYYKTKSIF